MKKIAYDSLKLDQLQVIEDSKCCLKVNAVITKEGVYPYPDGKAFKSRMELLKAATAIRYAGAKIVALDHPDSMVVMSQKHIQGGLEKVFFDRDKIRAVLNFDKARCSDSFMNKIRSGQLKDVSIGFYYDPDLTPGKWNGQSYDYVMRDIVIDHVAAGVLKGRCSFPSCGIGVDTMMRRIALDPFAGYKDFADCVSKNQDKDDPEAYCAEIKRQVEGAEQRFKSRSLIGGKRMKKAKDYGHAKSPEEIEAEFKECVTQRIADGYTQGEAEELCQAATKPEDEPTPPGGTLDTKEQSPHQICVKENMAAGMTQAEAEAKCKETGTPKTDQDAAFENCVARKKEEGMSQEEAEKECRAEHPVAEGDQQAEEVEPSPMERCVQGQIDLGKSEEEAKTWCEAELAGEHEQVDTMLERSQKLIRLKQQDTIEKRRRTRTHPL